jgi:membrane associated rhomboid family serine protease
MGLSALVFLAGAFDRRLAEPGVLFGPAVAQGQWWRLFTSLVTHFGPIHLLFNLSVVWTVGRVVEFLLGSLRFLLVTLVTGLGSGLFVLLFNFEQPTVGMSGAILGWVGLLLPLARREWRRELLVWLAQVALLSLLPGVSWAGHLGGFLAGLPLGVSLRRGPEAFAAALPVTAFVLAIVTFLAGSGRLR